MNFGFLVKFHEEGFEDAIIAGFLHREDAQSFIDAQSQPANYCYVTRIDEEEI